MLLSIFCTFYSLDQKTFVLLCIFGMFGPWKQNTFILICIFVSYSFLNIMNNNAAEISRFAIPYKYKNHKYQKYKSK